MRFVFSCVFILLTNPVGFVPAEAKERDDENWPCRVIDGTSAGADGVRFLDVNGDGLSDIATGWEEGNQTKIYLHPGYEKVREPWPTVKVGETRDVEDAVFADLDGDGIYDVVSCTEGSSERIFFHWAPRNKTDYLNEFAWTTEALPASCKPDTILWFHRLDESGRRWKKHAIRIEGNFGTLKGVAAGDLDGDKKPEIVFTCENADGSRCGVGWLSREGEAVWKTHELGDSEGVKYDQPFLVDLNGDGKLDVVTTEERGGDMKRGLGIVWYENPF